MFENVLVGVDGSENGRDAIALASRLAGRGGTLTLAHVHRGEVTPSGMLTPGLEAAEREASERLLERERAAAGVEAELSACCAPLRARALHERAEEQRADLLVVGSCSHGAFGRAMLGDDTRGALNGAPCAVAIAPRGYAEPTEPPARGSASAITAPPRAPPRSSSHASSRLPTAARARAGGRLAARRWRTAACCRPRSVRRIEEMLDEANTRLQGLAGVEGRAAFGLTGEELAAFGEEVDMLVVGSRGYGPVRRLVLGSTGEYLERHARCPLLVLPRPALRRAPPRAAPLRSASRRRSRPVRAASARRDGASAVCARARRHTVISHENRPRKPLLSWA